MVMLLTDSNCSGGTTAPTTLTTTGDRTTTNNYSITAGTWNVIKRTICEMTRIFIRFEREREMSFIWKKKSGAVWSDWIVRFFIVPIWNASPVLLPRYISSTSCDISLQLWIYLINCRKENSWSDFRRSFAVHFVIEKNVVTEGR